MKVQIYISNDFCKDYMPFMIYRNIIHNILSETLGIDISCIYNLCDISGDKETIVILNMYDLTLYEEKENVLYTIERTNARFVIINTEHWKNWGVYDLLKKIQDEGYQCTIFEYNVINYNNIISEFPHVNMLFLPLVYNDHLENYYTSNITQKISWNNKDIDVLFYGGINERRKTILDSLKNKYNVHIISSHHGATNSDLCKYIERSKIVINVLYYDYNVIFDYYRNTLLLSNGVLLVSEMPLTMDTKLEPWIKDIETNMQFVKYNELKERVEKLLSSNKDEIQELIKTQCSNFKKYDMKDILIPYWKKYFQ
jgi:hypothetical protein